jgi:FHS family L-fucose permease-like MFS transporter
MSRFKGYTFPFVVVTVLFFLWGFITVLVDSLVPRLRDLFELDYGTSGLFQTAFFLAYFVVSIPAGMLLAKIGYRRGIVVGLVTIASGCLLYSPAASTRAFGLFIMAFFVVAAGMALLQVAANPYVAVLGDSDKASSRLNLAQAFNSLGTMIAPLIGAKFLLSDRILSGAEIQELDASGKVSYFASEAAAVQLPFVYIGGVLLVLAIIFAFIPLPKLIEGSPRSGFFKALKFPQLRLGAIGILLYVGTEVAIGTFAVLYFVDLSLGEMVLESEFHSKIVKWLHGDDLSGIDQKGILQTFIALYWGGAMVGRFIGSFLTRKFAPSRVLMVFGSMAIIMLIISLSSNGLLAMWAILAVGLFNSIMFPTIFTMSIDGTGEYKPQASGILCSAIVGGAIIPPIYGWLTDVLSFKPSMVLFILCYAYIAFYGLYYNRIRVSQE